MWGVSTSDVHVGGFQASSCGGFLCGGFPSELMLEFVYTFPGSGITDVGFPSMLLLYSIVLHSLPLFTHFQVIFQEGNPTLPHQLAQLYWYSKNYVPPSTPMLKSATPYTYPNMVRFGNPSQRAYLAVCLSSNVPSAQSLTRVRSGNMQDYKELLL